MAGVDVHPKFMFHLFNLLNPKSVCINLYRIPQKLSSP